MMHTLLLTVIGELLGCLRHEPHFFSLSLEEKKSCLQAIASFSSLVTFVCSCPSEEQFLSELEQTARILNQKEKSISKETSLITALLATAKGYLLLPESALTEHPLYGKISLQVQHLSILERAQMYNDFCRSIGMRLPHIVIESSHALPSTLRDEITLQLNTVSSLGFPFYKVNPSLLGGIRIFIDGVLHDYTLLHKLNIALDPLYSLAS